MQMDDWKNMAARNGEILNDLVKNRSEEISRWQTQ